MEIKDIPIETFFISKINYGYILGTYIKMLRNTSKWSQYEHYVVQNYVKREIIKKELKWNIDNDEMITLSFYLIDCKQICRKYHIRTLRTIVDLLFVIQDFYSQKVTDEIINMFPEQKINKDDTIFSLLIREDNIYAHPDYKHDESHYILKGICNYNRNEYTIFVGIPR